MNIDASDLNAFADELAKSPEVVRRGIRPVVTKGALNIKSDYNQSFWDSRSFKGVGGTVTFDTEVTSDGVEAQIGPDKDRHPGLAGPPKAKRAAGLAHIAILGGPRGGGSVVDPQKHLDAEAPKFEAALEAVIRKALS